MNLYSTSSDFFLLSKVAVDPSIAKPKNGFILLTTCNVRNITARVMREFGCIYEEVGKIYDDYFRSNWEEIRYTTELQEYFSTTEEKEDPPNTNIFLDDLGAYEVI
jgi:hypothetical protein